MQRTIVIGDVHGCFDELGDLLQLVSFVKGTDRLVQVGDLVDRGPGSVECVRLLRELGGEVVLGNHEDKHIRWRKHVAACKVSGKKNPMKPFTEKRAAINAGLSDDDMAWLESLPLTLELGNGLVVAHAGLEPAYPFKNQSKAVIRVRYVDDMGEMIGFSKGSYDQPKSTVPWAEAWKGPESVIYGHAVHSLSKPRVDKFRTKVSNGACYGIDTGCVFGGVLTAAIFVDKETTPEFAQVSAREKYWELIVTE